MKRSAKVRSCTWSRTASPTWFRTRSNSPRPEIGPRQVRPDHGREIPPDVLTALSEVDVAAGETANRRGTSEPDVLRGLRGGTAEKKAGEKQHRQNGSH